MAKQAQPSNQELEVKFYLSHREAMEEKLNAHGAPTDPRVHEVNLRLDTSDHSLASQGSLLRLRQDSRARMTYKAGSRLDGGATLRQELEVTVSDFDTTLQLLEALGFQVLLMYEKYRTTYRLGEVEVDLDETPLGDFIELEGPDGSSLEQAARVLGLDWSARILESYTMLFEHVRQSQGFDFRDLSFENFEDVTVPVESMGVRSGDE